MRPHNNPSRYQLCWILIGGCWFLGLSLLIFYGDLRHLFLFLRKGYSFTSFLWPIPHYCSVLQSRASMRTHPRIWCSRKWSLSLLNFLSSQIALIIYSYLRIVWLFRISFWWASSPTAKFTIWRSKNFGDKFTTICSV